MSGTPPLRGVHCLVTGGAGYVGSHVVHELLQHGAQVTVLDNLYSGHRWAIGGARLIELDIGARQASETILALDRYDAVLHFAGHIWVGESVRDPGKYYATNTAKAAGFFELVARAGVRCVVFSSTAAVYGTPAISPIPETCPLAPVNPYGASKMMAERILQDIAAAHDQRVAILRYFNVAGAHDGGSLGEATPNNSHLVKVACEAALGLRPPLAINGVDYPTRDGTCVRDYVHVQDLAEAHVIALCNLLEGGADAVLNCGYGHGFSVREVLDTFRRVTGIDLAPSLGPPRPGDPAELVADNRRIIDVLGWQPQRADLERIIASAWAWEQRLQQRGSTPRRGVA